MSDMRNQSAMGTGGLGAPQGGSWKGLRIIPIAAWIIAVVGFVGIQAVFWFAVFPHSNSQEMDQLPLALKIFLPLLAASVLFAGVLLDGYVYADAKRRGMRYVMWTALVICIPYLIGVILYFLLRDPLPTPCSKCGFLARGTFLFCPNCGTELLRACRTCHRKIEPGWTNCAYCGTPVGGQAARVA